MSHSGIPGASLLSSNPHYNPLGQAGTLLPEAAAAAAPFVLGPAGLPISAGILGTKGGFQLSQGNTLGGVLDLAGAGLAGAGALGVGPLAPAPAAGAAGGAGGAAAGAAPGDAFSQIPASFGDVYGGPGAAAIGTGTSPVSDIAAGAGGGVPQGNLSPGTVSQLVKPSPTAGLQGPVTFSGGNPVGGPTGPASGATPGAPGFLDSIKAGDIGGAASAAGQGILNHPGLALSAAGLGFEALKGQPAIPNLSNLQSQADQLAQQGAALRAPLTGAPLPTGAQSAIDQGVQSAQAAIRSHFASAGLSGSSMEASALAQAEEAGVQQRFQVASQMAQQGAQLTGMDLSTYQSIIQATLGQDQQLQNAIANFAGSMAGGAMRAGA